MAIGGSDAAADVAESADAASGYVMMLHLQIMMLHLQIMIRHLRLMMLHLFHTPCPLPFHLHRLGFVFFFKKAINTSWFLTLVACWWLAVGNMKSLP